MNRKEYNIAVKEYANRLYGYALKYLRNEADASDIVQDVFEKLWKNRKKVEVNKCKSWLFTCAHNAMVNFVKKNNRIYYVDDYKTNDNGVSESNQYDNREIIEKSLALLPPVQKSVLLLRDLEGYNYKEIGDILNLSEAQVKVYLFRARNKIKKQLKDLTVLL